MRLERLLPLGLSGIALGCGEAVPPTTNPPPIDTDTDGIYTSGVEAGVDDTAGSEQAYCITNNNNPLNLMGVKHVCDVEYDLTISFMIDPLAGSNFLESHATSVASLNESTYEHPLVSVCCTDVTDYPDWSTVDACELPHYKPCMIDLIEHVCHAPASWLLTMSLDNIVGNGRDVIQEVSEDFALGITTNVAGENLRDQCINHFLFGPDQLNEANLCDSEFWPSVFTHTPWEPSIQWSLAGSTFFDFKLELRSNIDGVEAPPTPADSCDLPPDNNGEIPPFSRPGSSGGFLAPVDAVPVAVEGPQYQQLDITGSGDFSVDSWMHREVTQTNKLVIDQWVMIEESSATVGTTSTTLTLDGFKLELVGEQNWPLVNGGWNIPVGSATFNLAASTAGIGYSVPALNSSDIDFHTIASGVGDCPSNVNTACLVSSTFDVEYIDATSENWVLTVDEITWHP